MNKVNLVLKVQEALYSSHCIRYGNRKNRTTALIHWNHHGFEVCSGCSKNVINPLIKRLGIEDKFMTVKFETK